MNKKEKALLNLIAICQGRIYKVMEKHDVHFDEMASYLLKHVVHMLIIDAESRLSDDASVEDLIGMIEIDVKEKVYQVLHDHLDSCKIE